MAIHIYDKMRFEYPYLLTNLPEPKLLESNTKTHLKDEPQRTSKEHMGDDLILEEIPEQMEKKDVLKFEEKDLMEEIAESERSNTFFQGAPLKEEFSRKNVKI